MSELDKRTDALGWDRIERYDRSLFRDPAGEFVMIDDVEEILAAVPDKCPFCGATFCTRQDRYTDGEWARSESYGCPNHCDQVDKQNSNQRATSGGGRDTT